MNNTQYPANFGATTSSTTGQMMYPLNNTQYPMISTTGHSNENARVSLNQLGLGNFQNMSFRELDNEDLNDPQLFKILHTESRHFPRYNLTGTKLQVRFKDPTLKINIC
jgi:hypothetical protein